MYSHVQTLYKLIALSFPRRRRRYRNGLIQKVHDGLSRKLKLSHLLGRLDQVEQSVFVKGTTVIRPEFE